MFTRELRSRVTVLDAVGDHPYHLFAAGMSTGLQGLWFDLTYTGQAVIWSGDGPFGRLAHGTGDPSVIDAGLADARTSGLLEGIGWINLPRRTLAQVPRGWAHREDWDYLWRPTAATTPVYGAVATSVPTQPKQDRVRPVDDAAAIESLLDVAFPGSMLRPGHPMVNGWYGAYDGDTLVACAADRSVHVDEWRAVPTGMLGAIAVHPDHRGQGWGAAVTAALADVLAQRYAQVGLGVVADNHTAARLYARLGFTGRYEITSIRPVRP